MLYEFGRNGIDFGIRHAGVRPGVAPARRTVDWLGKRERQVNVGNGRPGRRCRGCRIDKANAGWQNARGERWPDRSTFQGLEEAGPPC